MSRSHMERYPLQHEGSLSCSFERHQPAAPPSATVPRDGQRGRGPLRRQQSWSEKVGTAVLRLRRSSVAGMSSRWDPYVIQLTEDCIRSVETHGFLSQPVAISSISSVGRLHSKTQFHLDTPNGVIFFTAPSVYSREQWYYSIQYRFIMSCFNTKLKAAQEQGKALLVAATIKDVVNFHRKVPIVWEDIHHIPIEIISRHLKEMDFPELAWGTLLEALGSQGLDLQVPSPEICDFLSKHLSDPSFASLVDTELGSMVMSLLKKQEDYRRSPHILMFLTAHIQTLFQRKGKPGIVDLLKRLHTSGENCPHQQVFDNVMQLVYLSLGDAFSPDCELRKKLSDFLAVFEAVVDTMLDFDDWRLQTALKLQEFPFPEGAWNDANFVRWVKTVVARLATDSSERVRLCLLPSMGHLGWVQRFTPSTQEARHNAEIFATMIRGLRPLMDQGWRRQVLESLVPEFDACCYMVEHSNADFIEVLAGMLEMNYIVDHREQELAWKALRSTVKGRNFYNEYIRRQTCCDGVATEPFCMPPTATDDDVANALQSQPDSLTSLNLTSTAVTGEVANHLIRFRHLKSLSLWSTPFTDKGLRILADNLFEMVSLDLSETQITDEGLKALSRMTSLEVLRLNSTQITAEGFQKLKKCLPKLVQYNVDYTAASE